ncbi:Hypothetical predicted protein [Podarcis lilfordi]|uniref:Uncharacterized protein n=1 Tax=Podarcis lilfordi TaxID=74358 RepID=A0AA35PDF0_9SAUR|nr:Hypothetical predicted protein [Podarcis lilfordi]
MATKVNEQSLDASCSDPAKERDPGSTNMAEHQDLDRGEAKAAGECSGGGAEHSEMTQQPTDQRQAPRLQTERIKDLVIYQAERGKPKWARGTQKSQCSCRA